MGGGRVLNMNRDNISTSLCEIGDTELRLDNHEMDIQGLVSDGAEGIDNEGTDGDVGDKTTIHDIDMNPISTSFIDSLDLLI